MHWTIREVDGGAVSSLAAALDLHPVTARCLAARGITDAPDARGFLAPRLAALRPPQGLADLGAAVERLAAAVARGERIGCFGDYDVDGVTTAALVTTFLRAVGGDCAARVARRDAGYGFGPADVAWFADAGCRLVITGDCGTSDLAAIRAARGRGIDVIVIDHHTVPVLDPDAPHPALALINPHRPDSTFPFRGMASVGLAFYVMAALRTKLDRSGHFTAARPQPDMRALLDLVAVGTVADLVPLVGENRILTHAGLRVLERRRRPGFAALLDAAGVSRAEPITERTIGWKLAPRLNAPGRLGDAAPALALLTAEGAREAESLAEELERANARRRELQQDVWSEALAGLENRPVGPAVVVAGRGWPSGVVGIVAAKLVERYQRPAFAIAIDAETGEGRGSARGVPGVHLCELLSGCREHLVRYGGHAGAAGLTVSEDRIDALRGALCEAMATWDAPAGDAPVCADAEVALADVDGRLTQELAELAPFGLGNEPPLLLSRRLRVVRSRRVGDGSHLKLDLEDASGGALRPAIGFGLGDADPGAGAVIHAAYAPAISTWGGRTRVELTLQHISPA